MSVRMKLELEVLSGPLDGSVITLSEETEWTRREGSRLSFPWDKELGLPQAYFQPVSHGWMLKKADAARGTHVIRGDEEVSLPTILQAGDLIRASDTWLSIRIIE